MVVVKTVFIFLLTISYVLAEYPKEEGEEIITPITKGKYAGWKKMVANTKGVIWEVKTPPGFYSTVGLGQTAHIRTSLKGLDRDTTPIGIIQIETFNSKYIHPTSSGLTILDRFVKADEYKYETCKEKNQQVVLDVKLMEPSSMKFHNCYFRHSDSIVFARIVELNPNEVMTIRVLETPAEKEKYLLKKKYLESPKHWRNFNQIKEILKTIKYIKSTKKFD